MAYEFLHLFATDVSSAELRNLVDRSYVRFAHPDVAPLVESLAYMTEIMRTLGDEGCDAVVLGCTEIPLLVTPDSSPLPTLDSTRLLARAALKNP